MRGVATLPSSTQRPVPPPLLLSPRMHLYLYAQCVTLFHPPPRAGISFVTLARILGVQKAAKDVGFVVEDDWDPLDSHHKPGKG